MNTPSGLKFINWKVWLIIVISLIGICGYAIYERVPIKVTKDGIEISLPDEKVKEIRKPLETKISNLENEINKLKAESIRIDKLSEILEISTESDKEEIENIIKAKVKCANELNSYKNSDPIFWCFLLRKVIASRSIDLRKTIEGEDKEEGMKMNIKLIQRCLKKIDDYEGDVNGNRSITKEYVMKFQQKYNDQLDEDKKDQRFKEEDIGIFGNKTLTAIETRIKNELRKG